MMEIEPYTQKCDMCANRKPCRFKWAVTDGWTFCDSYGNSFEEESVSNFDKDPTVNSSN